MSEKALILKCSTMIFNEAKQSCSTFKSESKTIVDLVSMSYGKSYDVSSECLKNNAEVSAINESSCETNHQYSCFYSNCIFLDMKFSTFFECKDSGGCSFGFFGTLAQVSFVNMIDISSSSKAGHGLFIFGNGCVATFKNCSFSHTSQPSIVSFWNSKNEDLTFIHCWFNSKYNTLEKCKSEDVLFVNDKTYVIYDTSASCILQAVTACSRSIRHHIVSITLMNIILSMIS